VAAVAGIDHHRSKIRGRELAAQKAKKSDF